MTMADERTVESDAWAVISNLRDQHPRVPNDCPTDYIVEALAAAGLLAVPAPQSAKRRWRDRSGDVWLETVTPRRQLVMVEYRGQSWTEASPQNFEHVEDTWGPLVPVDTFEDHTSPAARHPAGYCVRCGQDSTPDCSCAGDGIVPAAPADDDATVERVAVALWETYDARPANNVDHRYAAFWRVAACAALAALLARYDIRERGETATEPDGAAQIVAERHRVVTAKGYDAAHDDQHVHGELLDAARCYANQGRTWFPEFTYKYGTDDDSMSDQDWPWWAGGEIEGWKPSSDPVRNLVKAGQFIAAEIDRLKRAKRGTEVPDVSR